MSSLSPAEAEALARRFAAAFDVPPWIVGVGRPPWHIRARARAARLLPVWWRRWPR